MAKIFISYSSVDRSFVENLARDLRRLGHHVWFDNALLVGQDWWDTILAELRGCDVILYAVSGNSLDSEACRRELQYGRDLQREVRPIIVAEGVSYKLLPDYLQRLKCVDLTSDIREGLLSLIESLGSIAANIPLPDPLPIAPEAPISPLSEISERLRAASLSESDQVLILHELRKLGSRRETFEEILALLRRLLAHPSLTAQVKEDAEIWLKRFQMSPEDSPRQQVDSASGVQGMARLTVRREAMLWNSRIASYRVLIDGEKVAALGNGDAITLDLPAGRHTVQIRTGPDIALLGDKSEALDLTLSPGDEISLHCQPPNILSLARKIQLVRHS